MAKLNPKTPKKRNPKPNCKSGEVKEERLTRIQDYEDNVLMYVIDQLSIDYLKKATKGSIVWQYFAEAKKRKLID